jgi:hypothetical protein
MLEVVTKRHIRFPKQHVEGLFPPSAMTIKNAALISFLVTGHTKTCISIEATAGAHIIIIIIMIINVSCHRPFLTGTSLVPAVIPTAQASSFTLQYFPYYV